MKIAQVAPLMESVPPRLYGGTERIVSYVTEELVEQGHDVTLFASGDSRTRARLVPCTAKALRLSDVKDPIPYHLIMLDDVRRLASSFDVLHFHIDMLHYPMISDFASRTVTTLHGRLDLQDMRPLYKAFREAPLVSISTNQRKPMPPVTWAGCIHHGLPQDLLKPLASRRGDYLAFLGRISPEKRPDRAIEIARKAGLPLKIAAKVDKVDEAYFRQVIEPMIDGRQIEYIGEINESAKSEFLGQAAALLFPIDWPEPFGLVMIEAMACGTPVLAFRGGSVPEIIDKEVTGHIVSSVEEAVAALPTVLALDRRGIRRRFEERFSSAQMATQYVKLYQKLLIGPEAQKRAPVVAAHALNAHVHGRKAEAAATAPHKPS